MDQSNQYILQVNIYCIVLLPLTNMKQQLWEFAAHGQLHNYSKPSVIAMFTIQCEDILRNPEGLLCFCTLQYANEVYLYINNNNLLNFFIKLSLSSQPQIFFDTKIFLFSFF